MKKKRVNKLISFLTLTIFLLSIAGISFAEEIITFGYNQDRQRSAGEKMFPPILTGWYPVYDWNDDGIPEEVGETRSQPLVLDGSRFGRENPVVIFMAKNHANNINYLYGYEAVKEEDLQEGYAIANDNIVFTPVELDSDPLQVSRSSTTFYEDVFVSGTADGRITLHEFNSITSQMEKIGDYILGTDIVSAPMIVKWEGVPVVISGSDDGNCYLLTNFHLGEPTVTKLNFGGHITSSPTPIYNSFIPSKVDGFVIGRDDSTGKVRGYYFEDLYIFDSKENKLIPKGHYHAWEKTGISGVPSSFTTETTATYFADKYGRLTKVNNKTGETLWTDTHHTGSFINNSPAVDDEFVYFAIKDFEGTGKGAVVILNKDTADPVYLFKANSRITTSPVVWEEAGVVMFGCENGHIVGFWKDIIKNGNKDVDVLALDVPAFNGNDAKMVYPSPRTSISGLTGEISIAQRLLVLGGQMPIAEGGGVLVYQLADTAPDWFVKEFKPGLPDGVTAAELGGAYVASVKFGANGLTGDKPVSIHAKIDEEQVELFDVEAGAWVGKKPENIIVYPSEDKEFTFAWETPIASSNIKFEVEINPDRSQFEKNYTNNYFSQEVPVDKTDIEVIAIDQTSPVKTDSTQTAKVTFGNSGTKNTPFVAKYYVDGALITSENITLAAGGVMQKTFSWTAPSTAKTVQLRAVAEVVNDAVPGNNQKSVNVQVKLPNYTIPDCQFGSSASKSWEETYALIVGYGTKTVCDTDCWEECDTNEDGSESCHTECDTDCWQETDYSKKIWDTETVTYNESLTAVTTINTKQDVVDGGRESRGAWAIVPYAQANGLDPKMVTRAGYGFEVKVQTTYNNDWETKVPSGLEGTAYPKGGQFQGPTKVEAEFYDTNGAFVEAVELVPTSGAKGDWSITWELPNKTHTFHDGTQVTERKHYVPLNTPDGNYTVRIIVYNAGKHDLSICQDKAVKIYGSMYDDVYYRPDKN